MKGRIKEGTDVITGDDRLKHEGQEDQATGKVKENVERGIDKSKDVTKQARWESAGEGI